MLDARYRIQDAGYRMQDTRYRMQDAGMPLATWYQYMTFRASSPSWRIYSISDLYLSPSFQRKSV